MEKRPVETQSGPMRVREKESVWTLEQARARGKRRTLKNLSVASALLLCAVALRMGAVPPLQQGADAVLTAACGDTLLDDRLGKLSFVSSLFPEAVLVFGEAEEGVLAMPVSAASLEHAWSREEAYTTWQSDGREVYSAIAGEVSGVYHGPGEELLVQITGKGGLSCVLGNLAEACVQTGDAVDQGQKVGELMHGQPLAFEVRQNGRSVDPSPLLPGVS